MYHTRDHSRKHTGHRPQQRTRPVPGTRSLTARWRALPPSFDPAQVETALAAGGDLLTERAFRLWVPHAETFCRDYGLSPETVADVFGPEFHASAIVTVAYGTDCLYRQIRAARRFLNRPDIRDQLNAWQAVRMAS